MLYCSRDKHNRIGSSGENKGTKKYLGEQMWRRKLCSETQMSRRYVQNQSFISTYIRHLKHFPRHSYSFVEAIISGSYTYCPMEITAT